MTTTSLQCRYRQAGHAGATQAAEVRVRWVIGITLAAMVLELAAGALFGSLALAADGWHMGTHALALAISAAAYVAARRYAGDPRFAFGTGKIGPLAAYTSAFMLLLVALSMSVQAFERMLAPVPIRHDEALVVAIVGLAVNLVCAWILRGAHAGDDHAGHGHGSAHGDAHRHDHGLAAAYLHVLADALTSLAAILALVGGKYAGWDWLDPLMSLAGAALIGHWALGLMRGTGRVLLDAEDTRALCAEVRRRIEGDGPDRVLDLHVWRAGGGLVCILTVRTPHALSAADFRARLAAIASISHLTVEVERDAPTPHSAGAQGHAAAG